MRGDCENASDSESSKSVVVVEIRTRNAQNMLGTSMSRVVHYVKLRKTTKDADTFVWTSLGPKVNVAALSKFAARGRTQLSDIELQSPALHYGGVASSAGYTPSMVAM